MTTDSYNDIGQLLRAAREERRLELDEISQALHIRVRYLDALECGKLSDLPGLSYTKGYLQVYATYVGLDKDEILRRFEEVEAALGKRGFYFPQVFRKEKAPSNGFIWGGLGAALLVYLLWLAVMHPPRLSISLVEPFPGKKAENTLLSAEDAACFNPQPILYPPCTMKRLPTFSLVSLQARVKVVMDPIQ